MDSPKIGRGTAIGLFGLGLLDTAFSTIRQLDWIKNNTPGAWRPMISLYAAIALMAIGILIFWRYRPQKDDDGYAGAVDGPKLHPSPTHTSLSVTGSDNVFENCVISQGSTHGSHSPIIHGSVHGPVTFNQGAGNQPTVRLKLCFDLNDPQCKQPESPFDIPQHLFRVRVNSEGAAHRVKVKLERVPASLNRFQGVSLQIRHHPTEDDIDIIDGEEYFDVLLYNSWDKDTKKPVLFVIHRATKTLGWAIPVDNYEFMLKAYSTETTSNTIVIKFTRRSETDYSMEQV